MKDGSKCILRLHSTLVGAAFFDFYENAEGAPLLLRILNIAGMIPGDPWISFVDFQLTPTIIIEHPCGDLQGLLPLHPCFEGDPGVYSDKDLPGVPSKCVTKNCDQHGPVADWHCRNYGWSAPEVVLAPSILAQGKPPQVLVSSVLNGTVVVVQDLVALGQSSLPIHLRVYIQSPQSDVYLPYHKIAWDPTPLSIELRSQPQSVVVWQPPSFAAIWMKAIGAECATSLIQSTSWLPAHGSIGVASLLKVAAVCPLALSVAPTGAKAAPLLLASIVVGPCCVVANWLPPIPPVLPKGGSPDAKSLELESGPLTCPCPKPTLSEVPPTKELPPLDLTTVMVGDLVCCKVSNWMGVAP